MRLSELTRPKPTNATVDLGDGDTIELVFDRNKITPAWIQLANERAEDEDALALPKALVEVIFSWDVLDDDGTTPYPITPEGLSVFSYPAQKSILQAMLRAAVPADAEGKGSSSSPSYQSSDFEPAGTTSQNGLGTSPSLAPSASPSPT